MSPIGRVSWSPNGIKAGASARNALQAWQRPLHFSRRAGKIRWRLRERSRAEERAFARVAPALSAGLREDFRTPLLGIAQDLYMADRGCVGERVFLCDDDEGYRILLREILGAEGMQIVGEGGDGSGCVEAATASDPDVVLLDLNMPGMNGFEALPHLRAGLPNAKVIVLSASPADRQSVAAAHMLGADGYLSKPLDIFKLPALLRQALVA